MHILDPTLIIVLSVAVHAPKPWTDTVVTTKLSATFFKNATVINDFEYDFINLQTFYKMVKKMLNPLMVFCKDFGTRGRVWVSNYIPLNIVIVITDPFPTYPLLTSTSTYKFQSYAVSAGCIHYDFILHQRPTCTFAIFIRYQATEYIWGIPKHCLRFWKISILAYSIYW